MISVKNLNNSTKQFPKTTCKCKTCFDVDASDLVSANCDNCINL